jgi:thymidylate synthase
MTKTINSEVLALLSKMDREDSPRGLKVVEEYLTTLEFNPLYPMMNFENKGFNWKYFVGELWWYLTQETTIDKINNFSSFWKTLTVDERINSNYGYVMLSRQHNQFKWALNALLKDRSTRQAIMVFNTPVYQQEGVKDFVCTMYVNFWIRDNKLNMKVQMRSNDIFYGLQYDAPFFSVVYQSMYLQLKKKYEELEIGTYYHCSDNTHYYERHFSLVEKLKNEQTHPDRDVEMRITRPIFDSSESGISKSAMEFVDYMEQINDFSVFNTYDYIDIFHKFFVED